MAPGNPFKSSGKGEGGLLGAGGLRSDQWDDQELEQPSPPSGDAAGSGSTAAAANGAAAAPGAAPVAAQRSAAPGYTAAEAPLPPPPPPVATGSFLPQPPPATQPPTVTGVPASTAGAWGAAQPAQQPGVWAVSSSQFDSSGPAGYPPASGYPPPAGGFQPQYGGYGAPSYQAQQWTGGYSDQPLTYTTFEQSAGAQQQPMGCWGWGEQWACFIIGILIWPLWYVAVCWFLFSKRQSSDPRQRTPFILNCIASFVFTFVWVAIVVRETTGGWSCDGDGGWCVG